MRLLCGTIFLLILNFPLFAQKDSLAYHTDLFFLTSNQSFQPHWQVSDKYGIFDRNKQTEFVGLAGFSYQHRFSKKFKIETNTEFLARSDISTSRFQQLFLNVHFGSLQLKIGKEAYTMAQYSDELSSGSIFVSNNAQPIPRIGMGFYEFTPVPLIGKYLEFKGVINLAKLDDDRNVYNGVDNPWYHEKFFYLKSNSLPINISGGINHSVLFGGTKPNGNEIKTDWLASFFALGSEKVGDGEATNAAGGHFGLYDFGLSWQTKGVYFQGYYQLPFADDGGLKLFGNKDLLLGLLVTFDKSNWISSINYEYITTTWQGDAGVPDAVFDGKIVNLLEVEDPDAFMLEQFDTVTVGFTNHQLKKYCEDKLNYGYEYNGRDDLYNNGLYPAGQSYHGYGIGPSLVLSKRDMQGINSEFNDRYDLFFVSNRVIAHHLAFSGSFGDKLSYRTKITYSRNYGSYAGANKGKSNWASKEDPEYYDSYYFKDGVKQAYTFFELNYTPLKDKGAKFTSSIAYDFGEMYHNFGILLGFHYDGFFKLGQGKKAIQEP